MKIFQVKSWHLYLLLGLFGLTEAANSKLDSTHAGGRLAVLDLVDVSDNQPKPEISDLLRKNLISNGKWSILTRDSVLKRMTEFNLSVKQGCNNPQCSFDIGNIAQTELVLYGTVATFSSNQILTLKVLHIPTAKIVWTRVLEVSGISERERNHFLERNFSVLSSELAQLSPSMDRTKHGLSLAVIDVSENSPQSKALLERITTRVSGNPVFDPMSPNELAELLTALEINKFSVVPSVENMVGLGQKLGVSHLLYSRLYRDGNSYIYRLAIYDINSKAVALELPPQPSEDLLKLLDYEKSFFNTLFSKVKEEPKPVTMVKENKKSRTALWISLGILGVGTGVAAYWVENLKSTGTTEDPISTIKPPLAPPDPTK